MKTIAKHLFTFVLSGLLISCGTGIKEDQTESIATKRTFLTDFTIIGYSGPPLQEVTLERYQEIAESGIEYLVPGNGTFKREQNLKAMELGLKTGIKIIPVDMRLMPFTLEKPVSIDTSAILEITNEILNGKLERKREWRG